MTNATASYENSEVYEMHVQFTTIIDIYRPKWELKLHHLSKQSLPTQLTHTCCFMQTAEAAKVLYSSQDVPIRGENVRKTAAFLESWLASSLGNRTVAYPEEPRAITGRLTSRHHWCVGLRRKKYSLTCVIHCQHVLPFRAAYDQ